MTPTDINPPDPHKETLRGLEFNMRHIEGGSFRMGSKKGDEDALSWEKPDHDV